MIEKRCSVVCDMKMSYDVERTYRAALGAKLAEYILAEDDVNVSWPCQMSDGNLIKDSIISYLDCLGENLIIRRQRIGHESPWL